MPFKPVVPSDVAEELGSHLDFLGEVVDARQQDLLQLGNVCEEFSTHYRALGICMLSENADVDGFFHHLIQSALTRRHYLQGVRAGGGGEPRYRRASFIDPVLDAIAAHQWQLATDIFALVSHEWLQGEEYEDDFAYADFLRRLLTQSSAGIDPLLEHWARVLEGGEDLRLDVAKALHTRDVDAFGDALRRLLRTKEAEARAMADPVDGSLLADDATFFPNRWVSIEGLALLTIAGRLGIEPPDEFQACPPLARAGEFGPFQSRGYPGIAFLNE